MSHNRNLTGYASVDSSHSSQFAFLHAVPHCSALMYCHCFSFDYPTITQNSCAFGALSLASLLVFSCHPRDVVPRFFHLSPTLCVVSVRSAVSKPRIWHCPHSASRLLRSVAKSSETSCCKLQRISPQDGPVDSSKSLHVRQRVTSNVQAATLDVCSDYAHSNRAIVPKLSWTSAVRQGNKFPQ